MAPTKFITGALVVLAACSSATKSATTSAPVTATVVQPIDPAPTRIALATGYRATAILNRIDSITLTLPDGTERVQRMGRHLKFEVTVGPRGKVTVQLDSLALSPTRGNSSKASLGATWIGDLTLDGLVNVEVDRKDLLTGDITSAVLELFPALPRGGAVEGEGWADTTSGVRQIEIFGSSDRRRSHWRVGQRTRRAGIEVMPVTVEEQYEQQGRGSQGGREMQMSAQGSRSATYYLTIGGRLDRIEQVDSAERLITIPSTRQAVPTRQLVRTVVVFLKPSQI